MSEVYDYFQQGKRHLKKGMAAQATVPLEKAKRREPNKASIRESLGIAYFRIGRYDEAAAEFRAMLELSPADDYAHYALGRCLEKQGHVAEANGHYKLARSLRPGSKQYAARVMELEGSDERGLAPKGPDPRGGPVTARHKATPKGSDPAGWWRNRFLRGQSPPGGRSLLPPSS